MSRAKGNGHKFAKGNRFLLENVVCPKLQFRDGKENDYPHYPTDIYKNVKTPEACLRIMAKRPYSCKGGVFFNNLGHARYIKNPLHS